jgi:hypothetical protein
MAETRSVGLLACILVGFGLAFLGLGCGVSSSGGGTRVLGSAETMQLLRQLPYRYAFRKVSAPDEAEAAVAGRAIGPHHTVLNFGIALGHGHHAVPVPRAGTAESYGYPRGGFIFTTDTFIKGPDGRLRPGPQFKTGPQWREASHMEVMMTDKLCLAATGDHCPI